MRARTPSALEIAAPRSAWTQAERALAQGVTTTIPDSHRDLLDQPVATLGTLGSEGRPQLTEVWFLAEGGADDGEVKISLNTARQKVRNLQRNPACSVLLLDLANPYRYVEIRGDAVLEPDDDYAFADRLGAKYGPTCGRTTSPATHESSSRSGPSGCTLGAEPRGAAIGEEAVSGRRAWRASPRTSPRRRPRRDVAGWWGCRRWSGRRQCFTPSRTSSCATCSRFAKAASTRARRSELSACGDAIRDSFRPVGRRRHPTGRSHAGGRPRSSAPRRRPGARAGR